MDMEMVETNHNQEQKPRRDSRTKEIDLINRDPKQINHDVVQVQVYT